MRGKVLADHLELIKVTKTEEIIMVDGMPCIRLDNTGSRIRGGPNMFLIRTRILMPGPEDYPKLIGPDEVPRKDFTRLQNEKTNMFMKELLQELKRYGWNVFR